MVVAIDGYSSTGKSTVAKLIAARLGLVYIDTGAMYRAVTLAALRHGLIDGEGRIDEAGLQACLGKLRIGFEYNRVKGCNETCLNGVSVEEEIRGMQVADHVSAVAALPFVRKMLVEQQREMGRSQSVILDGRDVGTVVFPQADVKFFMTASVEVRAQRRYKELAEKGENVTYEEVKANVEKRDYIDSHREVAPLRRAEDAIVIDNSDMTVEDEVELMVERIKVCKIKR